MSTLQMQREMRLIKERIDELEKKLVVMNDHMTVLLEPKVSPQTDPLNATGIAKYFNTWFNRG